MIPPFQLKKTVGRSYNVDLDDVRNVKSALQGLGYYRTPGYGMTPYPDGPCSRGSRVSRSVTAWPRTAS